ncbi:UNVERIFIED_CONTAM: Anaphase-promoting complex subunit [Sesamum calycinum]|uniref:Anaphase-promoting complex subunit n=1 Tax=Sesamum calycinum TaxID=2727403 RepID=A0AAW2RPM3_9LAMI
MPSHLILKDPLEDPQITYIEERGKLNLMREFDERTIWTSDFSSDGIIQQRKMQHSLWVVEVNNSNLEAVKSKSSDLIAPGMSTKHSFRRIWQWKGSQTAASFLATDDDVTPIICFLLQEQKKLLSLRVQILEINNETVYDIKPDMSWSISAIAAAAVTVTRPKARLGQLPLRDVIALTPESTVLLHSRFYVCAFEFVHSVGLITAVREPMLVQIHLPFPLGKEQFLSGIQCSGTNNSIHDLKIVDLADAVEGRVNIVLNNGQSKYSSISEAILWLVLFLDYHPTFRDLVHLCNETLKLDNLRRSRAKTCEDRSLEESRGIILSTKASLVCCTAFGMMLTTGKRGSKAHSDGLDLGLLVVLLSDIADFLHEVGYLDHYKHQSGNKLSSGVTCNIASGLYRTREELTVLGMVGEKFGLQHLDLLPAGVSLPLRHLRYGRDLRLNEVRRLLCSARPVAIQTPVNPTASDQDFQQTQLWHLAQRTTALPFGRGAFTLGTICTLLTEALAVPKLVLAGRLPAQQNATGKMSRTWILYNKPDEPNVTHAGLLLALGLHGHLRVLTITDIFQYYSQSLYVHLPARHPSSFPELELPTLIQSAALISVGLLYEGSAHPQTMQILLGEIGRRSGGDNVLEREGYAVSAGFSLGLVALGCGEEAIGSTDTLVDRLFQYIGGKELHNDRVPLFSSSADEHNRNAGQIIDGNLFNIDVTAPGAIIALALMYLKTESQLIVSRLSIPQTKFELQYVRPDFIYAHRSEFDNVEIHPSEDWIEAQIPEVVKNGVKGLGSDMDDQYEMDAEAFVQAYVNISVGACISLGLRFAGTRDGNAQELLYKYAIYFLNEIKPVCVSNGNGLPKGLSIYVDRGTLETCLHLIVLSLCLVMAGSGHLQTFRFLKFLRNRNSADGHAYFGTQMAVSLAIGFLFLGGGMWTFSTSNSSVAALLITLYPRLPTGPNDNRCHLQAFRHLYVLATEARWIQTVDVDTGLPVYVPLEVTIKETELYAETSFCEVTPCSLPERAILKAVRVCGPRYWPQVIELCPKEKPWWNSGDKHHPFNSGVLYVKRKVGACSYVDDPIGSQSLLSRAMHKMSGLTQPNSGTANSECTGAVTVEQLVSTFSSDPSLIAFAQLFCDSSWSSRQEFCLQVLFECVSKDRPAMLQVISYSFIKLYLHLPDCVFYSPNVGQVGDSMPLNLAKLLVVYLSLYTTIGCMVDSLISGTCLASDSLSVSSLKIALAYNEALSNGRLTTSRGEIVQSVFLGSLKKRVEDLLNSLNLTADFHAYTMSGKWPTGGSDGKKSQTILSWYLQWHSAPSPLDIKTAVEKINCTKIQPSIPLLRLVFPRTHIAAIDVINSFLVSLEVED